MRLLKSLSSLRAVLLLLFTLVVLPAGALLINAGISHRNREVAANRSATLTLAQLVAANQGRLVNSVEQLLDVVADWPEVAGNDQQACAARLSWLLQQSANFRALAVANADGTLLCSAQTGATTSPINPLLAGNAHLQTNFETGHVAVVGVISDTALGKAMLVFDKPTAKATGAKRMILAGVDTDAISRDLAFVDLPEGGALVVLDSAGRVIALGPDSSPSTVQASTQSRLVETVLATASGITSTAGADGVQRVFAFAPYRVDGRPVLYSVVGFPMESIVGAADRSLRDDLVSLSIVFVLSFVLIWLVAEHLIVQRVKSIKQAARQLEHGNLQARTDLRYGQTELDDLARSFDTMAAALQLNQTERDQAVHQLSESEERYRALVRTSNAIVWRADAQGNISQPVPSWEDYTGQAWPEYRQMGWLVALYSEDRAAAEAAWHVARSSLQPVKAEYRIWNAATHRYRYCQMQLVPRLDPSGKLIEWVGAVSDIDTRAQAENAQRLMLEVSSALAQSLNEHDRLAGLAHTLVPSFADWCAIALVTHADMRRTLQMTHAVHASESCVESMREVIANLSQISLDEAAARLHCLRTGRVEFVALPDPNSSTAPVSMPTALGDAEALNLTQLRALGLRQLLYAPMMARGEIYGVLAFGIVDPNRCFDANALSLAEEVAQRATMAIDNLRLYEREVKSRRRAERSADYLTRHQALTRALVNALTPAHVAQAVLDAAALAFGSTTGAVSLVNERGDALQLLSANGYPQDVVQTFVTIPFGRDVAAVEAAKCGKALWFETRDEYWTRYPATRKTFVRQDDHACAVVPMMIKESVVGVIALNFNAPRQFSHEDKTLLLTFAEQATQALERARLYQAETQARNRAEENADYLARLQSLTAALSSVSTPLQVLQATVDETAAGMNASAAWAMLLTEDGLSLELVDCIGLDEGITSDMRMESLSALTPGAEAVRTGRPMWVNSAKEMCRLYPAMKPFMDKAELQAFAVVPIVLDDEILGHLSLGFDEAGDFGVEEKDLLLTAALQCAQALERARLFESSQRLNATLEERVAARTAQLQLANAELVASRQHLRDLSGQILSAVEEERTHIAREVHDELGQALTVIRLELGQARLALGDALAGSSLDAESDHAITAASGRLSEAISQVDFTLRAMRRLATELRPVILDDLGLVAAIEWQVQEFQSHSGVVCRLVRRVNNRPIDAETSITVFRILQETLTNVAKHAQATEVVVTLRIDSRRLFMSVQDDGIGIAQSAAVRIGSDENGRGFGLLGMQERAARVYGCIRFSDKLRRGTTVKLFIPLRRDVRAAFRGREPKVGQNGSLPSAMEFMTAVPVGRGAK